MPLPGQPSAGTPRTCSPTRPGSACPLHTHPHPKPPAAPLACMTKGARYLPSSADHCTPQNSPSPPLASGGSSEYTSEAVAATSGSHGGVCVGLVGEGWVRARLLALGATHTQAARCEPTVQAGTGPGAPHRVARACASSRRMRSCRCREQGAGKSQSEQRQGRPTQLACADSTCVLLAACTAGLAHSRRRPWRALPHTNTHHTTTTAPHTHTHTHHARHAHLAMVPPDTPPFDPITTFRTRAGCLP